MSTTVAVPELTVREQRAKQLKNVANKSNANKNTQTNVIYEMILKEYNEQKSALKSIQDDQDMDDAEKPIRNIFKMSRVLVDSKKSQKGKSGKQSDLLKKINDADGDTGDGGPAQVSDEFEMNYSVSSESEDEIDHSNIQKFKLPAQEYQLVDKEFPPDLLKAQGRYKNLWDFLIIALAVYQALIIPFNISFAPDFLLSPSIRTMDSIIDLIFTLDIILRFRTTYIDQVSGEEVDDTYLIGMRYMKSSQFFLDVISTVPLDDLFPSKEKGGILQFLGLFKVLRVFRISNVIMNLNQSQELKALLKVVMLIFYMFLYIHMSGCIWNYFVIIEEKWIPNMDFIWFGVPQVYDYYITDYKRRFLICLYIGFYLFGVGEICPSTQTEILVAIPILVVSSIMNGLIIGNMALYLSELNRKGSEFQDKMDTVNTAMNNLGLSSNLSREIQEYFITNDSTSNLQKELEDFMKKRISKTYAVLCSIQIFKESVRTNYITNSLLQTVIIKGKVQKKLEYKHLDWRDIDRHDDEVINKVVSKMETMLVIPEQTIVKQDDEKGELDNLLYLIAKGRCQVEVQDKFKERWEDKIVRMLQPGDHFGEISMLYNCRRSATVKAYDYCTCATLNQAAFQELVQNYQGLNDTMKKYMLMYDDPIKVFLEISLNQMDYFKNLPQYVKNEWLFNMQKETYEKGSYLYKMDTNSSEMYVIQSGMVEVVHKLDKGQEFVIDRLYRHSVVNQNSFILNDGIDTDAKCKTIVTVYKITNDIVKVLRKKHQELDKALTRVEQVLIYENKEEPALDYIVRDPYHQTQFFEDRNNSKKNPIHDYNQEEYVNKLTLKLKNAVMVYWLKVKQTREKKSFDEIIKELREKQRYERENNQAAKDAKKKERLEKKETKKKERQVEKEAEEAHITSYINKDQFNTLYENILDINKKIIDHSDVVDEIEKKLLDVNKRRKKRRENEIEQERLDVKE